MTDLASLNPFLSALDPATGADTAAAPDLTDPPVAAAVTFTEPTTSTGGHQEAPADTALEPRVDAGLLDFRFVLDETAFMEAIEAPPAFLASPGLPYLAIVEILSAH